MTILREENARDTGICPLKIASNGDFGTNCDGSECMAWRWAEGTAEKRGYCGMAGAPIQVFTAAAGAAIRGGQ